jgi:hypothetical protein
MTAKRRCYGEKDRDDTQHQPTRAPKGGPAQATCAAQACFSQARPQMRAYSISKARQQAGEFFIIGGGQSRAMISVNEKHMYGQINGRDRGIIGDNLTHGRHSLRCLHDNNHLGTT